MSSPTDRLLGLLSLLQARREWPAAVLSARLGVSARTVRRDVDRLRAMGYRVTAAKGPSGGYRLEAGSELPPMRFDDAQAVAIAVALRTASVSGAAIAEDALRALATVRQVLPAPLRHRVDALEVAALDAPGAAPVDPEVLLAVAAADRAGERLRLVYDDRDGPSWIVEPYGLVVAGGRWYLVAFDPARERWRLLRVDRIAPLPPTGVRFTRREVPGGDARAFALARFRGATDGTDWPCTGSVVLPLPAARIRPFAGEGRVEKLPSGTRLTLGAWSWMALAAAFARFDVDLAEVEPVELRRAFDALATRAAHAAR
ncbi:helix-turn-helix transcriptional regulator [Agrococcus sp. SGAir0287]|uniref:helix-turn-helix transcriptional regulator n=1 Tax=Agrococcus sp. SGAir0287 TaxID=2070347 RepID=UPI0010CD38E4|nr:WYL domain-containing protein [Agrococcus sp. SGAir0287]QCR18429.1 transcriptional regulator [Agrococcus sp. SGAir0287]